MSPEIFQQLLDASEALVPPPPPPNPDGHFRRYIEARGAEFPGTELHDLMRGVLADPSASANDMMWARRYLDYGTEVARRARQLPFSVSGLRDGYSLFGGPTIRPDEVPEVLKAETGRDERVVFRFWPVYLKAVKAKQIGQCKRLADAVYAHLRIKAKANYVLWVAADEAMKGNP